MDDRLAALYRQAIRRHRDRPVGKGPLAGADARARLANPLCGDEVAVSLKRAGDRLAEAGFEGESCAICQASASMLVAAVREIPLAEAARLADGLIAFVKGKRADCPASACPDLPALEGVRAFPGRLRCATLPWEALQLALEPDRAAASA